MTDRLPVVLGIDPGAGKGLLVYEAAPPPRLDYEPTRRSDTSPWGGGFWRVKKQDALSWLTARVHLAADAGDRLLLCWDAPLVCSFTAHDYTRRPVEKEVGDLMAGHPGVNVLGYSGLDTWTITLDLLGLPAPDSAPEPWSTGWRGEGFGLRRLRSMDAEHVRAAEVHPAVSLACVLNEVPPYKGNEAAVCRVVGLLEDWAIPSFPGSGQRASFQVDDYLDAWLAWKTGMDVLAGTGGWVGDERTGGFVLPRPRQALQTQSPPEE